MWCRTILTAVAISYVICMLLWSGLQKEDLDAKTLEKLGRYNVNIDDMNNEKWRQECLSGHVTTEVQREAFRTFANTEGIQNHVSEMYPKVEKLLTTNFDDIAVVQHEVSINKSKGYFDPTTEIAQKMHDLGNVTKIEGNKAAIKIEYDLQNQQNVESVMNVWTKLTRYNTTVVTTPPAIPAAPTATTEQRETYNAKNGTSTVQAETHNSGYVHSREMEHISRMLAEYLASQTIRTTTQRVPVTKEFPNDIPIKYWKSSNKASVEEKPNRLNEQGYEISNKNNDTQNNLRFGEVINNSLLDGTKSMPFDVTYDSAQLIQRIQVTPHTQIHGNEPKLKKFKPVKKNNPLGILFNLLQSKSDLYNNGVLIPETESTSQTIKLLTNKSNEQQEKKKSYNLFDLFQIMNFANKKLSKKFILNNVESTIATIKANTWESVPLSNEKINKEFKASPIDKKEMLQLQKLYEQFKAAPSNIIKTRHMDTYDDETMNTLEPEQVQKYNTNNNRIKLRPPDINKSKLYQNSYKEHSQPWFQASVPSVIYSSLESTNNQVIEMSTRFNKLDQNENIQLLTDQNDAFKADSGIISKWGPSYDSIKMQSMNNLDKENEQRTPNDSKGLIPNKHSDSISMYELQAVKANIIKEIAEKVKRMVLKHIEEVSTTVKVTTTSTTITTTTAAPTTTTGAPTTTTPTPTTTAAAPTTTTAAPTTTTATPTTTTSTTAKSLSEKISTSLHQEFTQTNQVIQKLIEMFKELKAVKNTSKLASQVPQYTTTVSHGTRKPPPLPKRQNPQVAVSSKLYFMQNPTILKPQQGSSYISRMVVPINSIVKPPLIKAPQYTPLLNVQPTHDYHLGAITMQTNSDEIAPLAIQMSKPLKIISQNIVVTTTGKVDILKHEQEQISIKQIEEKLRNPTKANHREDLQYQSDVSTKHGRLVDDIKEHETRDHNFYKSKYMNREKPWFNNEYNGKGHSTENTHPDMSRFSELHYPGSLSHLQHLGRPRDLSNFENLNPPRGFSRPGFNKPEIHQNEISHHPYSLQSAYTNYDHQPRYEPKKFHEKLEKLENWPQGSWKELKVLPTESNNEEISGRQQMPLMKVKHRMSYDDSHFTNFLKSQQKVTDMLEKILANNVKNSGPRSVETL